MSMLIHRINIFLLSMIIAFAPAYSFAFSGNPLDFTKLTNAAKTATGLVGDYFFKDYAGTTYSAKGQVVSNRDLAGVWRNRWAGKVVGITVGVLAVEGLLKAVGWILDPANNRIYKEKDSVVGFFEYSVSGPEVGNKCPQPPVYKDAGTVEQCIQSAGNVFTSSNNRELVRGNTITLAQLAADAEKKPNTNYSISDYYIVRNKTTLSVSFGYSVNVIYKTKKLTDQLDATDDDIALEIAKLDVAGLKDLATSPDYLREKHKPTTDAAAKASPDKPTNCPTGQAYDSVKKTCSAPTNDVKPKDPADPTKGYELPEFCSWAMPVCDFIEWFKTEPEQQTEDTKVQIKERSTSDIKMSPTDFDTNRVVMSAQCPAPVSQSFSFMSQSVPIEFSYQPFCDFMSAIKPAVISGAFFAAAYIIAGANRE